MFGFEPLAGEHWVYRKGENAPFEHVEIVEVTVDGRKQRAKLRFVDDGNRVESVPLARLRTLWEHVDAYRQYIVDWDQLGALELDRVEESAIEEVFMTLVPESVGRVYGGRIHYVTAVRDVAAFEQLVGVSVDAIIDQCFSCVQDGVRYLAREGTLIACELMCRQRPGTILDVVFNNEAEARLFCTYGRKLEYKPSDVASDTTDPQWEWQWYLESTRPRLELLRQWCGYRAVTADERRRAAEQEARRLDLLLTEAIKELERLESPNARWIKEDRETGRITPERVRPQVDRPLLPSEMPIREIKVRSGRWW